LPVTSSVRLSKQTSEISFSEKANSIYHYEYNQQDALYGLIYYSKSALHVSGNVFANHQEHLTVFTVFGSAHPSCCRLPAGIHKLS
jgi:hypothetical protein